MDLGVRIDKNIRYQHLLISGSWCDEDSYSFQLLTRARIPGLLPLLSMEEGGELVYELGLGESLRELISERSVGIGDFYRLLYGFASVLDRLEAYMLSEKSLYLRVETIFVDRESEQLSFLLVPGYQGDCTEDLRAVLAEFLKHIDYGDKELVILAYHLFQACNQEQVVLGELLHILREAECGGEEQQSRPGKQELKAGKAYGAGELYGEGGRHASALSQVSWTGYNSERYVGDGSEAFSGAFAENISEEFEAEPGGAKGSGRSAPDTRLPSGFVPLWQTPKGESEVKMRRGLWTWLKGQVGQTAEGGRGRQGMPGYEEGASEDRSEHRPEGRQGLQAAQGMRDEMGGQTQSHTVGEALRMRQRLEQRRRDIIKLLGIVLAALALPLLLWLLRGPQFLLRMLPALGALEAGLLGLGVYELYWLYRKT